jgi:hypothetical protein
MRTGHLKRIRKRERDCGCGCVRVCIGVCGCVRVCIGVCGCARAAVPPTLARLHHALCDRHQPAALYLPRRRSRAEGLREQIRSMALSMFACLRLLMTTDPPSAANRSAMAMPMPVDDAVTTATRPAYRWPYLLTGIFSCCSCLEDDISGV